MQRIFRIATLSLAIAILSVVFTNSVALAHGHIHVGDYELVIGFRNEPAYQGEPNGLDLRVTNHETGEPVTGLADTLKAEIIFGEARRELTLRPRWGMEGSYTADIVPTETGDYTFRIFGEIEGTQIDESMTSSPETFNSVQPKSDVAFPGGNVVELQSANAAAQTAQTALIVGSVGAVLGLIGTVVGLLGLRARREAQTSGQARRVA